MSAATASIRFPISPPTSVAASAVRSGRSKYAGRTSTRSEMPRFVQSSVVSSVPSTRRRSGTGSIPQLGVSCKVAGRVPTAVTRAVALLAAVLALVATGCGSKPKPVTNAQAANKRLADSFDELADDFEPVKDARRKSIVEAGKAADIVRKSVAVKNGRAAIDELKAKGYDVGAMGSL